MSRYARKRDANHSAIVGWLEAHGVHVTDTSSAGVLPDLLTGYPKNADRGFITWIEVKALKKALFTYPQLLFISRTPFAVGIAHTREEALEIATTHNGKLKQSQKDRLAMFLSGVTDKKKLYTPGQVKEMLGA